MYSVSENYKAALQKKIITDRISGKITLSDGSVINLSDNILVSGALKITHELCGNYKVGTFNLGCLKIGIYDDNALLRDFSGALAEPVYEIKTEAGWETVPLGKFRADGRTVKRRRNAVYFTAYDNGTLFDCAPESWLSDMEYTAEGIITRICRQCGVTFGGIDEGLPNTDVKLSLADEQIQTCRDAVMWCASILCGYAVIDRTGALRIISSKYDTSDDEPLDIVVDKIVTAAERKSIYVTDTRAYIKCLTAYCGQNVKNYISSVVHSDVQAAPATYALAKNPLIPKTLSEEERDGINEAWLAYIDGSMQRGITAEIYGDPALDVGDVLRCSGGDIDQRRSIVGLVTKQEWRYRGYHSIVCAAPDLIFDENQTATTSVSARNQTQKRIDAAQTSAGSGLSKKKMTFSLNKAGYGDANIGGICINGWGLYYPRDKYEVDSGYLSALALKYAGFTGTGYRNFIGGICLGEGLENIKAENGIDYQRTAVAIGQGLEFVDVPSDEGSQSSYHKRVSVKLGDGLDFDANNALIASMKPATSSAIGGVKAGTNITIAEDGTISTPSYVGTDGVQITSGGTSRTVRLLTGNGLTFVDGKLTAFLGKNLKFSAGGEIESEFAVKNGIVFTNDESYKFIHNISEVLYQDSDYEVMTGAQDSFILNKELVYGEGKNAPNGVEVNPTGADSPSGIPDIPVKKDRFYIFDKACYYRSTSYEEITAIDLVHISSSASMNYDRYATRITYADGTTWNINSFDNYDKYSGYGMALLWTDIYPPGSTFNQTTFENGCVRAQPAYRHKGGGTDPYRFSKSGNSLMIGFSSKEEYYAAMGLVYGTVDLTDLVDDPESSGGGGSIDTGDKYKSPTVSLQRTTVGGRGAVKITVVDVLGTHTSYVYDGDALTRTSQLTNDSGFVARKSGVPYNVIAVPGANSAVLVWEKVTGAAKYRIQRLNNGTWGTIAYPTANSYRATGLTAGTEYAYRVLASMDGTTWGSASEAAYVTPFSVVSAASISEISETPSDEFEGEEVTTI